MNRSNLINQIRQKKSFLCVGLDPDPAKMPAHLASSTDGVLEFCKGIISATRDYCVAYKPNIAFFEALGPDGWNILYEVRKVLPDDCFLIADAKRADIGNSSRMYAQAFFDQLDFDAVTVAPYMGSDSVLPFLEYENKWTILLALTSNQGSADFQMLTDNHGETIYHHVFRQSAQWGSPEQLMYVVGATHPQLLSDVRGVCPEHFFLVPGVGAQGGKLADVVAGALTESVGLLVNATRAIIYASSGEDFIEAAGQKAQEYQKAMASVLSPNTL